MKKLILLVFLTAFLYIPNYAANKKIMNDSVKALRVEQTRVKDSVRTAKKRAAQEEIERLSDGQIYRDKKGNEWYNGYKVETGPRGGKYYINSNGNKTYIR